jgi:hypothetical protein
LTLLEETTEYSGNVAPCCVPGVVWEETTVTPEDLRRVIAYLELHVRLADEASRSIVFEMPSEGELLEAGLNPEGVRRLLGAPWLPDMVSEVVETPEFCEPEESSEQLLGYARDVVGEYIRKRFPL